MLGVENNQIIVADKDHVQEVLTSCLEEPLCRVLGEWSTELKSEQSKNSDRIISEIKNIQKQMSFEEKQDLRCFESSEKTNTDIVPQEIKDFLFRFASKHIKLL